ncbi:FadR/GntR family transcriptional regulator [Peribacillus cavernae]|nr:FadR/GntR family transcriptional regulator [Peribacillus cavernae]
MTLKPIKKRRLFEDIVLAVEEYIIDKNIQPGEKLPSENELSTLFNVSKTAVREAMSVLNAGGIIETRSGAGIFLREISEGTIAQCITKNLMNKKELQEILEFRKGLEIEAAALAATRRTEEDLTVIKQAHERLIEINNSGGLGVEEDFMFHYSIINASHNSIYKEVFDKVSEKFEDVMRVTKTQSANVPGRFNEGHKEHEQIIEALSQKNPVMASEAMRNHLARNETKIWKNIK